MPQRSKSLKTKSRTWQRLFSVLETVREEVRSNAQKLDRLLLLQRRQQGPGDTVEAARFPWGFTFPLSSTEEVERLHTVLVSEEDRQKMVRRLGSIGGRDLRQSVDNAMAEVIDVVLGRAYKYLGLKGEKSFSVNRALVRTIQDGVRMAYPRATDTEVKSCIVQWLSGSRDRKGGKRERDAAQKTAVAEQREPAEQRDHDHDMEED